MAAEGGTHIGHQESIARADRPFGPFEPCPRNPILTHRGDLGLAIQATGHGELIEAHDGSWWMAFLGIRPRLHSFFPFHHLGRETFLAPVSWDANGWPVVNTGKPVTLEMASESLPPHAWPAEPIRDDFDSPTMRLCWNYLQNPRPSDYSLIERPGWLRLHGSAIPLDEPASPTFVGRRQEHFVCRAATLVDFCSAGRRRSGRTDRLRQSSTPLRSGRAAPRRASTHRCKNTSRRCRRRTLLPIGDGPVHLEVRADADAYRFFYSVNNQASEIPGTRQARYLATEVVGGFTGVYLGLYAFGVGRPAAAPADFDCFEYGPIS